MKPIESSKERKSVPWFHSALEASSRFASSFPPFARNKKLNNLCFVTMTEYENDLPVKAAFPMHIITQTLGEVISSRSLKQLRLAESEKEKFVTKYFNGITDTVFNLEDRTIIPSPHVPTYDMKPEMSAFEITDTLLKAISSDQYQFIVVNYANPDMLGHTGNIDAAIKAIRALDECLGKVIEASLAHNCTLLITGDHGNIEEMLNPITNDISTEHSTNPVPFILIDSRVKDKPLQLKPGILADIAPTVLYLLNIPKPVAMTGRNLVEEISELRPF